MRIRSALLRLKPLQERPPIINTVGPAPYWLESEVLAQSLAG